MLTVVSCGGSDDDNSKKDAASGSGIDGGPAVGTVSVSVSPPSADFGSVVKGLSSSVPTVITVTNKGAATSLSPSATAPFAVTSTTCGVLAVSGTCTISLSFSPSAKGPVSGILTVATGVTVTLTGTGLDPGAFTVNDKVDLTTVLVGATVSSAVTVTALSAVSGLSCTTSGADITADLTRPCPATLAASASCTFGFTFKAASAGSKSDSIVCSATGVSAIVTQIVANVVTPSSLAFQIPTSVSVSSPVGSSSSILSFSLVNSGGYTSGALTVTPSGDAAQFVIDNQCLLPLAATSSCKVNVVFKPTTVGQKTLTLTVADASAPLASAVATVIGTATTPGSLTISGGVSDFGSVSVGLTSAPAAIFTVTNPGSNDTAAVHIESFTDASFVVTADGCSNQPLAATKSCTVSVVFKPTTAGLASANLIASASGTASASWPIKGTGVGAAELVLAPSTLDFQGVVVNTTSGTKTFTVTNNGQSATGALEVVKADSTSSVGGGSQFSYTTTCGASLLPTESCAVVVTFAPLQAVSASATITVRSVDLVTSSTTGTLLGLGLATASLTITTCSTASFTAGTVVGQTSTDTCVVTNASDTASGAIAVKVDGEYTIGTNSCLTANLQKSTTCTFTVIFTPTTKGKRTGTMTVTSANSGAANVEFSGLGLGVVEIVEYELTSSAATTATKIATQPYNFGQVSSGSSSTNLAVLAVYVRDTVGNLNIQSAFGASAQFQFPSAFTGASLTAAGLLATLGGGPAVDCSTFATSAPTKSVLTPVCYKIVSFTPKSRGDQAGTVTITGAAGQTDSATVKGTGTGPISISPSPVTFSDVPVGTSSGTQTIAIKNNGATTINALAYTLGGTNAAEFSVVSDALSGGTLASGATLNLGVKFIPTSSSAATATISVTGTLAGGAGTETASVTLSGNGVAASTTTITIANNGVFADTAAGAYSAPLTISISNGGSSATGLLTLTTESPEFAIVPPTTTPATLQGSCAQAAANPVAASGTCTYLVWFNPSTALAITGRTGFVRVTDAASGKIVRMAVSGNATPQLVISPAGTLAAPTDLGTTTIGTATTSQTFTVTNNGAADITGGLTIAVTTASTNGPNVPTGVLQVDNVGTSPCNGLVAKNGGTCTFKVTANATTANSAGKVGTFFGKVTASSTESNTKQNVVSEVKTTILAPAVLSLTDGTAFQGKDVVLAAAAPALARNLGTVNLGATFPSVVYTVKNTGGVKSSAITAALYAKVDTRTNTTAQAHASFTLDSTSSCLGLDGGLAPNATCDIIVKATPVAADVAGSPVSVDVAIKGAEFASEVAGGADGQTRRRLTMSVTASGTTYLVDDTGLAPASLGVVDGTNVFTVTKTIVFHAGTAGYTVPTLAVLNANVIAVPVLVPDETFVLTNAATNGCTASGKALSAGQTCNLTATWAFAHAGAATAVGDRTFVVGDDTSGTVPTMTLKGRVGVQPYLAVSRTVLDFGQTVTGAASQQETVVVTNLGELTTAAGLTTVNLVTSGQGVIHATGCGDVLAPLATCTLTIWVVPQATGAGAGTVKTVTGGAADQTVTLNWTGAVAPQIGTTDSPANFGKQAVLSTTTDAVKTRQFTFTNGQYAQKTGALTVSVLNGTTVVSDFVIVVDVPGAGTTKSTCLSKGFIDTNDSCTVTIQFTPTALATPLKSGQLTVSSTVGGTATVDLTGTAIAPLSATAVDTGAIVTAADGTKSVSTTTAVNATTDVEVTFTNEAGAPATGLLTTVLTSADGQFRVLSDTCTGALLTHVTPGTTDICKVKYRFAPTSTGAKTATISVSGTPGDTGTITLKGNP
jgi:hypothetical protein